MYVAILATWLGTILWFNPRLFDLTALTDSTYGKALILCFIMSLNVFWLYGAYYLMLFLFTNLVRKRASNIHPESVEKQIVAILYLTMNDFDYNAALSCVSQDYEYFHVYILDSSTKPNKSAEVDAFQKEFSHKATVIRRNERTGFKAGAINDALRNVVINYPYFAVVDADGVIPKNFLAALMPYFTLDKSIAFVHGNHMPNPKQKSKFAKDLALGLTPLWSLCLGPRNDYGFLPFLGHGGIIRRDVWEIVGGFPEIVSEDLAFSTKACELGYRGYFVDSVVSLEDFPATYQQLRKQQEKYVKGGCQYIHKYLFSFLKSSNVQWVEKIDVLIWLATLFIPSFHLFFILLFSLLVFGVLGEERALSLAVGGSDIHLFSAHVLGNSFKMIWTWDFYVITILNMFTPLLGYISLAVAKPLTLIRLLLFSTAPHISLMVVCTIGIITYLLTGKAAFRVTADDSDEVGIYSQIDGTGKKAGWLEKLNSSHPAVHLIELGTGVLLCFICIKTLNLALFAFSSSLVLGYLLLKYGWDNKILKSLTSLPFVLIQFSIGLLGMDLIFAQGAFFLFWGLHF
jgi:cellulose synthase/poly-beta-1,6-N-acetylglucosamine synthase-like glycosyltransferase